MASLDPNHWTAKVQAAWKAGTELACEESHSETTPLHLAIVLFEDTEGLARQVPLTCLIVDVWALWTPERPCVQTYARDRHVSCQQRRHSVSAALVPFLTQQERMMSRG
jgi:hypothetical protein